MRKSRIVIISILSILCLAVFFSCTTTAKWQSQYSDTDSGASVSSETANPSAKYIVYAALDGSGALIPSGSATTAASYAVVGYTGLVAELTIPATYQDTSIHANALPVTKVLVATPYASYKCSRDGAASSGDDARLANQTVVTSIVFGSNVTFVGAGVCAGMVNLATVRFANANATYTNAFLGISPTITTAS